MGKRTNVHLVDDVDGSVAHETVEFGIDGARYQIDLSASNAEHLRQVVMQWAKSGRRVEVSRTRRTRDPWREALPRNGEGALIREWCTRNGFEVKQRGRLPAHAVDAFRSAHADRR